MMRLVDQSARIERAAPKSSARGSRYPRPDPVNADTGTLSIRPGKSMRAASRMSRRLIGQPGAS